MRLFLIILLISLPFNLLSQDFEFYASAPAKIGVDQNFHLQYTLKNKQGSLNLGDLSDFRIVGGPRTSTSQSIQIINNVHSQTTTYTYTYTLQAKTTGNLTIPPATVVIDGQTYKSNSININVVDHPVSGSRQGRHLSQRQQQSQSHARQQQQQKQQQQRQELSSEDLFVRVYVNRSNVYRGQSLTASIKLYTKVDIVGFEEFITPAFNGFWTEEIESPGRVHLEREVINGEIYNVGILKQYVLFPRHSGELVIEPCELICQVRTVVRGGGRSLIEQFFGQYENVRKTIKSPEIKINVKELPPNRSPHFKGAVGTYNLQTHLSRDTLIVNEATSLEVKISGRGNLRMVNPPEINFPDEFEVFDPEVRNRFSASASGVNGNKTWDYTIIPRYPGIYDLGQLEFEYFDPQAKQYKSIMSEPIVIAVRQDEHDEDFGKNVFNYDQRSVTYIGEDDIRFIRTGDLNLKQNKDPLIASWQFKSLYVASLLIFFSFIIIRRKQIKENANLAGVKNKRARKIAVKRMKCAKAYMTKDLKAEFYKEVINAIWGYLSDKLNIEISEIKREKISSELKNRGIDDSLTDKLLSTIDKCEYAHFAPSTNQKCEMSNIYQEAVEIIKTLEQNIK